jgi:predicted AlkP superfamily pyrophosphatase or phosphodiesterase
MKFFWLLALLLLGVSTHAAPTTDLQPTVILVAIDGFHPNYLTKYRAPNLNQLAQKGVRARWMTPSYPTLTFPNFYTIATGLLPQNHGIVGNSIYDPNFDATFGLSKREEVSNARWWGGEPIWVTAEKQGQRAATYFFPGSEAPIGGIRPSFWKPFDEKVPNFERVDGILNWLDLPAAQRPTFFTVYFDEVDHAGHDAGPNSPEVAAAVANVDAAVGRLVAGLGARGLVQSVNLVVVSDHGMTPQRATDVVLLDDYFELARAQQVVWSGQIVGIFPKSGEEDAIYRALKAKMRHARVFRKADVPARFRFNRGPRIAPLICIADEGWAITQRSRFNEARAKTQGVRGAHGYDNRLKSMRAIFIAHGPAFKRGAVVKPFQNTEVYGVMTRILGLKPAPNDGTGRAMREVLRGER